MIDEATASMEVQKRDLGNVEQVFLKPKNSACEAFTEFFILRTLRKAGCRVPFCYEIVFDHPIESTQNVEEERRFSCHEAPTESPLFAALPFFQETEDFVYLKMEKVGEKDLFMALVDSRVESRITWKNLGSAISIATSTANVLSSVHYAKEVHGDVKLENFVLDPKCLEVWIIDFEKYRFTPAFSPPMGQARRSMQADAWMLGIVIFLIMLSSIRESIPFVNFQSERGYHEVMKIIEQFNTSLGDEKKACVITYVVKMLLHLDEKERWTASQAAEALSKISI